MSRYNKLARPAALSRQTTRELFFPHAANRLRSDINEVLLSYDEDNKVAIMECHRVSRDSRVVVGRMYTRSQLIAQEMLTFNGFYEYPEGRWKRIEAGK